MSDHFDELYDRYSDGTLSDDQRAEFLKLLETPELRQRFVAHATYETAVGDELKQSREQLAENQKVLQLETERYRQQEPRRGNWRTVAASLVACAALTILGFMFFPNPEPQVAQQPGAGNAQTIATVTSFTQPYFVMRNSQKIDGCKELIDGDRICTAKGQVALKYVNEETTLSVANQTQVSIANADGRKILELHEGSLVADVAPQKSNIIVRTKNGSVEVLGTKFRVSARETLTQLDVLRGKVKLIHTSGTSATVVAHQTMLSAKGGLSAAYASDAGEHVRVMSFGLGQVKDQAAFEANLKVLQESNADIISLQKIDMLHEFENTVAKLAKELGDWHYAFYPFEFISDIPEGTVFLNQPLKPGQRGLGNAIVSKHPIVSVQARTLFFDPPETEQWKQRRGILCARIRLPSLREVSLFSAHTSVNAQEHTIQAREIDEFVRKAGAPHILTGILHFSDTTDSYALLSRTWHDAWKTAGKGYGHTHPMPDPKWRNDYVFFSGLTAEEATLGPAANSDHRAVIVDFKYAFDR